MNTKQKSTKQAIKTLVKECLLEILAEGLVGNNTATLQETRELRGTLQETAERSSYVNRNLTGPSQVMQSKKTKPTKRNSHLDKITMGIDTSFRSEGRTDEKRVIENKVSRLTNDPIMSDILADTAMTTLKEQREGGGRSPSMPVSSQGDAAAKIVDQSLPEDLFGGSASKWADLAFAPSIRMK